MTEETTSPENQATCCLTKSSTPDFNFNRIRLKSFLFGLSWRIWRKIGWKKCSCNFARFNHSVHLSNFCKLVAFNKLKLDFFHFHHIFSFSCRLVRWLGLGSQVDSTTDHFLLLLVHHREDLNMIGAELAGVITNSGLMWYYVSTSNLSEGILP